MQTDCSLLSSELAAHGAYIMLMYCVCDVLGFCYGYDLDFMCVLCLEILTNNKMWLWI